MNSCCQSLLRCAALASLLLISACASKGATSLDEDADQPASVRAGQPQARCGNDRIDDGEECDGDDLDGVTCTSLGFDSGELSCDPTTCRLRVGACMRPSTDPMGGSGG